MPMTSIHDRLMRKTIPVTECGCWIFYGAQTSRGYGQIGIQGKSQLAHRVSYELFCGPIPDGLDVMHSCDLPICINPDHLSVGTRQANMDDMVNKKRQAFGEKNARARITEADVLAIRSYPGSLRETAKIFNVCKATVGHIRSGRNWKHT